ncbi:hypothetical protein BH11PSE9_BH11PSE9_02270 [soil metagenome]
MHNPAIRDPADNLVKMANQIGGFFAAQAETDAEAAAQSVASHLKLFWAPSMRAQLLDRFEREGGRGLLPVVQLALRRHAGQLLSSRAKIASPSNEVFPEGGGDAG